MRRRASLVRLARQLTHTALRLAALAVVMLSTSACGTSAGLPKIDLSVGGASTPQDLAGGVQILILLTVLALAPSLLVMATPFTRLVIVLSFTRNAIGVPQTPPNQVLVGLALFLTLFISAPMLTQVNDTALQPFARGEIDQDTALARAQAPVRAFMLKQTREKDIALFIFLTRQEAPRTPDDVPTTSLAPAFIISELKTAFQMGFVIFIPFLIIDMVVSSTLMSMGMMMLPPSLVSLPFKVLLFIMVDGWHLLARSLLTSFN
ncbi:MAG: flagellar type III secretion system pore protein FliP [Chloroflexi bacterium]|nr:flagellar type III secretion system pore protein FliP [Chloroflexota bacterium]